PRGSRTTAPPQAATEPFRFSAPHRPSDTIMRQTSGTNVRILSTSPIIQPMSSYTQSIQTLMNELARLPGIGMRSAERIAFHLLKQSPEDAMRLADAIKDVKTRIKHCSICYN